MTLGARIKALREARGWSQSELSRQAKLAVSAISYFEQDERKPSAEALVKLANALEASTDYLLGQVETDESLDAEPEYQVMYRRLKELPKHKQKPILQMLNSVLDATKDRDR